MTRIIWSVSAVVLLGTGPGAAQPSIPATMRGTTVAVRFSAAPPAAPVAATINITVAEVQNGVAVVQGNKVAKQVPIFWETTNVGQTTKGGSFNFSGVVPADCIGELTIGADTVDVALANCPQIPAVQSAVPPTGQTKCWDMVGNEIACAGTGQDGEIERESRCRVRDSRTMAMAPSETTGRG